MIKKCWFPPLSPHSLIQEHLFPNEWLILVSCILLNCTSRKQVQKVIPFFVKELSSPESFIKYDPQIIKDIIKSLGFVNRRYDRLYFLATYIIANPTWNDPKELPGIGQYGADAWNMFCNDLIPETCPDDGSLTLYWKWLVFQNEKRKRQKKESSIQEL
jgi:methyl-CpG-binding domain protein 4